MIDVPTMDKLVEAGARALCEADNGVWNEAVMRPIGNLYRSHARAILSVVLPLVAGPASEALAGVVDAKALAGVRDQVAGWNGENRPDGPYKERHPPRLGATLPKTNCGAVYALDEALQAASTTHAALRALAERGDG